MDRVQKPGDSECAYHSQEQSTVYSEDSLEGETARPKAATHTKQHTHIHRTVWFEPTIPVLKQARIFHRSPQTSVKVKKMWISPMCLHGVVLIKLSEGETLPLLTFTWESHGRFHQFIAQSLSGNMSLCLYGSSLRYLRWA
jgi:hypothetical protein